MVSLVANNLARLPHDVLVRVVPRIKYVLAALAFDSVSVAHIADIIAMLSQCPSCREWPFASHAILTLTV